MNDTPLLKPFPRVAILGVGLLGASLGLALKKRQLATRVLGVGRANSPSLQTALDRHAIDESFTDPVAACQSLAAGDLIVLATPVRQFPDMLQRIAPHLPPGVLITDVGSTKSQVLQWAHDLLPNTVHFVGSHPMAGSEQKGPAAARDDLYENAVCLVCKTHSESSIQNSELSPTARITALWTALGMRVIPTDAATHDRWVATISHLPHALAAALVNTAAADPASLQSIAGGFLDTTRIAAGDTTMWTDIFLTNRPAVLAAIDQFAQQLQTFRTAIANNDEPAIRKSLDSARTTRQSLADPRNKRNSE